MHFESTTACKWRKIRIMRWEKSRFYRILAKIRINRRFLYRKTLETIRTTSFIRFWRRSRLTELYCSSLAKVTPGKRKAKIVCCFCHQTFSTGCKLYSTGRAELKGRGARAIFTGGPVEFVSAPQHGTSCDSAVGFTTSRTKLEDDNDYRH